MNLQVQEIKVAWLNSIRIQIPSGLQKQLQHFQAGYSAVSGSV